ncbi:MAG TPA: glycoside hydrolase family 3 N-terminal domain-containing protein [Bacteroidia bacterium]|nr:glycoside hydrolase family 3 N-terminal domain-containing protein [Bacteroidia bacterium]
MRRKKLLKELRAILIFLPALIIPLVMAFYPGGEQASASFVFPKTVFPSRSLLPDTLPPPFLENETDRWVDSVMKTMTQDEKIGQLFMVAAWSNKDAKHTKEITDLIAKNHIGGLIFMQGGPVRQAQLTNKYQKLSKIPLMIAMDAEWGLSMRLDSTVQFPREMTMGAMDDDSLVYKMGIEMARECKRLGVNVSFSPVADVNCNPANPVIGTRSFGENKFMVAHKAVMYMKGLQDGGVMACGKHFPGHGDTDSDSHKTLPVINHDKARMDSVELFPFKQLIRNGLGSMMVAHLYIPAYDTTTNLATTLSKNVVTGLLKEQLGFRGLVFTDALNMKGVSQFYKPGEVDLKALLAGNDVLLFSGDVPKAVAMIRGSIAKGELTQADVDAHCRKILAAKKWLGLDKKKTVKQKNLWEDLNTPGAAWLCRQMAEKAVTLLKNDNTLIPFTHLDTMKIASLAVGRNDSVVFQQRLGMYAPVTDFSLMRDCKTAERDTVLKKLQAFNCVVLSLHGVSQKPAAGFGIGDLDVLLIDTLLKMKKHVVLDVFGPAYSLNFLPRAESCDAVILSYENQDYLEDISAQIIFGGVSASGKIPVTTNDWKAGSGLTTPAPTRFKYTMPEEVGFSPGALAKIDDIVKKGMDAKAFPGCQVFAAKDGKVFLYKSYGRFTYDPNSHLVRNDDLYDIASVTKIMATVPAVMLMKDKGEIDLDKTLGDYLPELKGTNKEHIIIREMLAHQAGLQAWIPFWMKTEDKDGNYDKSIWRKSWSDTFSIYVAPGLFMNKNYIDTIYKRINESPVKDDHKFVYSDLGYYYLKKIIERKSHMLLSDYANRNFYFPLGLTTIGYQPRLRFPSSRCAPTENDKDFRKQQLQGDVHDQGAAMLGGIGGHAGVFSDANDVGVMMQLYLNYGTYGGRRYFDSATVAQFTSVAYPGSGNRRGIGFDKPEPDVKKGNPACDSISLRSFGHQGFTGTQAWADPETGVVFVFLSNRVYPDAKPNRLAEMGIRGDIMQVIIEEFREKKVNNR